MKLTELASLIYNKILDGLAIFVAGLIVFAMITVSADVFSRFLLNRPIGWVLEITEYIMLYVPMLGAAWLLRADGHVNIDCVLNYFGPKAQSVINRITSILCAIACAIIAYWGAITTWDHYRRGLVLTEVLKVPQFIILWVIPAGFFLLFIGFLKKAWEIKQPTPEEEKEALTL